MISLQQKSHSQLEHMYSTYTRLNKMVVVCPQCTLPSVRGDLLSDRGDVISDRGDVPSDRGDVTVVASDRSDVSVLITYPHQ